MPILECALERRDGGDRSTFLPHLESAWRILGPSSKPFGAVNYGANIDSLSLRSVTRAVTIKKPPTMIAVTAAACVSRTESCCDPGYLMALVMTRTK